MPESDGSTFRADYHAHVRHDVVPHVPAQGGALIDVGGGIGATAAALRELGCAERVGVLDIVDQPPASHRLVDFAYTGDLSDAAFVEKAIEAEGPFDTVLFLDILEHLVDPWSLVAQFTAALAERGIMVASIPNVRNARALFPLLLFNRWTLTDDGILDRTHLRFFVRSTAIELMTSTGLTLESVVAVPTDHPAIRWFRRLTFGLLNTFTDRAYVIVVRRAG